MKKPAKTQTTGKRGGKRSTSWKPGQSGNPAGAPKRGQSWTELIKEYGELTPSEAAAKSLELSKQLLSIGDGVTLKQAVILRVYASLLFEPQPGLFNAFVERAEGKVKDQVELTGDAAAPIRIEITYSHPGDAAEPAPGPTADQAGA